MGKIMYDFVELGSDKSFEQLGKTFGGFKENNALLFENKMVNGELIRLIPDEGLWVRKWKFSVFDKIVLRKLPSPANTEKRFCLVYLLNPSIFRLKVHTRKINLANCRNNLFFTNDTLIDFSVLPNQPFYVLDISFTAAWLCRQFQDADKCFKDMLNHYVCDQAHIVFQESCSAEEYKALHELEVNIIADPEDLLYIRSRTYKLVLNFFCKLFNRKESNIIEGMVHYDQVTEAERLTMIDLISPPKIGQIARKVNLSSSSLLRQFKLLFGKGICEYYIERKMELAKKMLQEGRLSLKETANLLGYKQITPFIKNFTKLHGFSPGAYALKSSGLIDLKEHPSINTYFYKNSNKENKWWV
jgi:AraC-like DNA-binding protein